MHCAGGNMGQSSQWTRLVCYRGEREEGQFGVEEAIWGSLARVEERLVGQQAASAFPIVQRSHTLPLCNPRVCVCEPISMYLCTFVMCNTPSPILYPCATPATVCVKAYLCVLVYLCTCVVLVYLCNPRPLYVCEPISMYFRTFPISSVGQ